MHEVGTKILSLVQIFLNLNQRLETLSLRLLHYEAKSEKSIWKLYLYIELVE
jgi:hypothetical protein